MKSNRCSLSIYGTGRKNIITGEETRKHIYFAEKTLNKYNSCPYFKRKTLFSSIFFIMNNQFNLVEIPKENKGIKCVDCVYFQDYSEAGWLS